MAELKERLVLEKQLEALLRKLSSVHAEKLRRYLELGTPFNDIPQECWDQLKRDVESDSDEKYALLLLIFLRSAEQHLKTIPKVKSNDFALLPAMMGAVGAIGARYVAKRLRQIAPSYVRYSKRLLRSAIRQRKMSPIGHRLPTGEVNPQGDHGRWIRETLDKMFGKGRVERIGRTEAHLSMIQGGEGAIKATKIKVARIWAHSSSRPPGYSNATVKPCPICSPREGLEESQWGDLRPGEAHPECFCFPMFIDEYGNLIGYTEGSDTLERFKDRLPPGFLKDREQLFRDFPDLLESVKC